jgi:hypothetical protein
VSKLKLNLLLAGVGSCFVAIFLPEILGLLLIATAVAALIQARTVVAYVLGLLSTPLGIAFDYFIRVDPTFYFYKGNGVTVEQLCLLTIVLLLSFVAIDELAPKPPTRVVMRIDMALPAIPRAAFYPLEALLIGTTVFVYFNAGTFLSQNFDNSELAKFPFLEYISLAIVFLLLAAQNSTSKKWIANISSVAFIIVALLASYRMVAIISGLALIVVTLRGASVNKLMPACISFALYAGLSSIAYFRRGDFALTLDDLLGYQNGRLDNNFTGVIETALIYTAAAREQTIFENLTYLIGTILPIPNTFIPDAMIYVNDIKGKYVIPGGGVLAGFVMYFHYLLAPIVIVYAALSHANGHKNKWAAGGLLIMAITAPRWWLYGPFALFKFAGVYIIMVVLFMIGRRLVKRKTIHPRQPVRQ